MSILNRNTLTAAVVVAVASLVSTSAMAGGKIIPSTQNSFAHEVTGGTGATNPTATLATTGFNIVVPDILIGRTNTSGNITVFVTFAGANLNGAPVPVVPASQGTLVPGSTTVSGNVVQFAITPPATGMTAGSLYTMTNVALKQALGLRAGGTGITATVVIKDTNTGVVLLSTGPSPVLAGDDATSTTFDPVATKIVDVATASAKKKFIGNSTFTQIGKLTIAQNDTDTSTGAIDVASTLGTGAATNDGAGSFIYDTANDTVDITLNVPNASAFTTSGLIFGGFYAVDSGTPCAGTVPGAGTVFVVDPTDPTVFTANVTIANTTGESYNICAIANGVNVIAAPQTISATAQILLAGALTIDPDAVNADITKLVYNGAVVKVSTFNPAGNTTQESFLRVSNTSSVSGLVTVDGIDDNGVAAAPISFLLPKGKTLQFNASDYENGNAAKGITGAAGNGTGKWRLTVTGEFSTMAVTSLNRNNTDQTLSNLSSNSNNNQY